MSDATQDRAANYFYGLPSFVAGLILGIFVGMALIGWVTQ